MKPLNKQRVFNAIWQYFILDGNPQALDEEHGVCAYRTDCGARCFIGLLIPDELYTSILEGSTPGYCEVNGQHVKPHVINILEEALDCEISKDDSKFLLKLQGIHDNKVSIWETQLRTLAEEYNLTIPDQPITKEQVAAMRLLMSHEITWESIDELIQIIKDLNNEASALMPQLIDAQNMGATTTVNRIRYETDELEDKINAIVTLKEMKVFTY